MTIRDPVGYAEKVMIAAKRTDLTQKAAAKEYDIVASNIGHARAILKFGTPEEIRMASEGRIGISAQADIVRGRLTPEQRKELTTIKPIDPDWLAKRKMGAEIWTKLHPALVNLSSMPDARSVVAVLKTHGQREKTTDANLEAAKQWLEEFEHAWKQYKQSKGGDADSGRGSPSAGGQHLKQAS